MNDAQAFDELMKEMRNLPPELVGPTTISREYRQAIEWVESLPRNQSGVDKTWMAEADEECREYFARVVRVA